MKDRKRRCGPWRNVSVLNRCRFLFFTVLLSFFLFLPVAGYTAIITLTWDRNTEPDLEGYRVYSGTSPGSYASAPVCHVDKKGNSCAVAIPPDGKTRYYAVTAYNSEGLESDFSNEVRYKAPLATFVVHTAVSGCGTGAESWMDPTGTTRWMDSTGAAISYISPSGDVEVSAGGTVSFQMYPGSSCKVAKVLDNGVDQGALTVYNLPPVWNNHTIEVQFSSK